MGTKQVVSVYMAAPDANMSKNMHALTDAGFSNPVFGGVGAELPWDVAMKVELHTMLDCDALHLPIGWEQSRGNRMMRHLAVELGMKVIYEHA